MSAPVHTPESLEQESGHLRNDAHYAYLAGRTKRARDLNRKADKLSAQARAAIAKATGAA